MSSLRVLSYAYAVLALYVLALASLTSMTATQVLPALMQLLICVVLFAFGYSFGRSARIPREVSEIPPRHWNGTIAVGLGMTAIVASILSAQYSTGMSPAQVISGLGGDQSLYVQYQGYTQELVEAGGGGALTIWFAMQVVTYAIAICAVMSVVARGGRVAPQEWVLLSFSLAAMAYSGLARGTGLEFFHVGSALLFALLIRPGSKNSRARQLYILVVAVGLASLYVAILAARGVDPALLDLGEIHLEDSWLREMLGPGVVGALLAFYSYFGFGSLYVSTFWTDVWLRDWQSSLLWLLPGGSALNGTEVRDVMTEVVEVGVRWHPDSVLFAANAGMLGFFAACVILGRLASHLESRGTLASTMMRYFVFLQMLAFPVGNFVWVDKAPLVVVIWLLMLAAIRRLGLLPPTFREFFFGGQDVPIRRPISKHAGA